MNCATLQECVKEFFRLLDIVEESDEGKLFHPNFISSCRVIDTARLNKVLTQMKELSKDN